VTFSDRFSATANNGFQSLFLTVVVSWSHCDGSFSSASLKSFSAASSESTISSASSGHASTHFGSPWQRSHAMDFPVSQLMVIPPCSQACTHQSQPLHFFSFMISKPVSSDCERAFSGHALTHLASLHARQDSAKLKSGAMRTTRILDRIGFHIDSPFSTVQAYSQIPQPMHFPGSTDTNFLFCSVLADCIFNQTFWF